MNCAPITVTGSAKRDLDNSTISELGDDVFEKRDMSSLPDMFVANIGNGCSTAESGTDLAFPSENLGKIVQRIDTGPLTPPIGNCVKKSSGSAGSNQPKPAGAALPIPSVQQPSTTPPVIQPTPSIPAIQPSVPVSQSQPQSQPQPQPTATPPSVEPSTGSAPLPHIIGTTTGTCPTTGKSLCSDDGLGFGTCDQNHVVIFQPVPPGTKCDKSLGVEVHARRRRHRF